MTRTKHTFPVPQVCIGCHWEERLKNQLQVNKNLRGELVKFSAAKRPGRKPAEVVPAEDREDERGAVPDVLDQMSNLGKIRLDD